MTVRHLNTHNMHPLHILLAVFIAMIWGLNFVIAKSVLQYMPPFFLLSCRLALVSLLLLPFMHKPQLPLKDIFKIAMILTLLHFGMMFVALRIGLDSSVAVVIDQMRVPFSVILSYFIFAETIKKRSAYGIMLALIGTFIITGAPNVSNNYLAMWVMLGASASWAYYNIEVKHLKQVDMLPFIGYVSLFSAPILLIISLIFETGQYQSLTIYPVKTLASLMYIAVFATIIGHGSWYYLLQKYPVNIVVPYSLLTPVFGMIAAVIFLNEIITWQIILGAIFTILGVAVIIVPWRR